jgi:RNA polymerase-interacting CarD/CdnL/TRCF family regulator
MSLEKKSSAAEESENEEVAMPKSPEKVEIPSAEVYKLSMIADLESSNPSGAIDTMKEIYRESQGENAEQYTDEHTEAWKSEEVIAAAIACRDRFKTEEGGTQYDDVADRINSEFDLGTK